MPCLYQKDVGTKWNAGLPLLKKNNSNTFSLDRVKEAMKTALSNAEYRFEYELTENQGAGPAVLFSSSPKQDWKILYSSTKIILNHHEFQNLPDIFHNIIL